MAMGPQSAMIIRAGGSSQEAIGSRTSLDRWAAELEVQLQRAGFTIRDRQLVETRLRQASNVSDYAKIADETGVEIILEIAGIREGEAYVIQGVEVEDGVPKMGKGSALSWKARQWEVTVDVIGVRKNARMGRVVGVSNLLTIAQAQGLWPYPDPMKQPIEQTFSKEILLMEAVEVAEQVPGVTCEYSNSLTDCRLGDPSSAVRAALSDVVNQLKQPRAQQ